MFLLPATAPESAALFSDDTGMGHVNGENLVNLAPLDLLPFPSPKMLTIPANIVNKSIFYTRYLQRRVSRAPLAGVKKFILILPN